MVHARFASGAATIAAHRSAAAARHAAPARGRRGGTTSRSRSRPPRVQCHAYSLSLQIDGSQALIVPSQLRACTPTAKLLKRLLDLTVATTALIVLSPVLALAALAVWLDSGSPVLYRQIRVGRDGKLFEMLKFRSMRTDAEALGPAWVSTGDSRTTRVGAFLRRTSIDELPQLFNVILGDMSIVGPRPATRGVCGRVPGSCFHGGTMNATSSVRASPDGRRCT